MTSTTPTTATKTTIVSEPKTLESDRSLFSNPLQSNKLYICNHSSKALLAIVTNGVQSFSKIGTTMGGRVSIEHTQFTNDSEKLNILPDKKYHKILIGGSHAFVSILIEVGEDEYIMVFENKWVNKKTTFNVKNNHIDAALETQLIYKSSEFKLKEQRESPFSLVHSLSQIPLPTSLESLSFGDEFNQIIQSNTLPTNLESLTFGKSFNQIIQTNTLPTNLKSLTFGNEFNQIILPNTLPTNLESLSFGLQFNQIIQTNTLPTNLKSLTFGFRFNQIILPNTLPTNLESLTFGLQFNQIILPNTLPTNLQSLTFDYRFNQIIQPNTLPTNLKSLTFGDRFNQIIQPNTLPTNLKSLTFGNEFNQIILPNTLPTNLQSLTFGYEFNQIIQANTLPTNLQSLTFGNRFNQIIQANTLPTNLESLTFGYGFNQIILPNTLPRNLESLTFGYGFNQIIQANTLPTNLKSLTFGWEFNQIIQSNTLPTNLQSLTFGYEFNQIIQANTLPTNLQSLTFGNRFNQIIQANTLPTTLESLVFGKKYSKFISVNQLTSSLKFLKIYNIKYPFLIESDNEKLSIEIPYRKWSPTDIFTIKSKRYHRLESFDNGINQVYLVACEQSHQLMICKMNYYKNYDENQYDRMYCEKETMRLLKGYHNFVQLIDYFDDKDNQIFYLFIEYYPKGDLHKILNGKANQTYYFPEKMIWDYISQLFSMLTILEEMKIVHCDIKPSNIFIGKDGRLILGGFSSCIELDDDIISDDINDTLKDLIINSHTVGSTSYFASEIKTKLPYSSPIDIYSVGSTILRLLSCHKDDIGNHDKFVQDINNIIISPERYSQKLIDFVKLLVVAKREDRQSLQMIFDKDQIHEKYIYKLSTIINIKFSENITDLELEIYNEPITSSILPTNIKSLKLGNKFNNKFDISQSNMLKVLVFGGEFNQIIQENTLSKNLESLTFGKSFNQIIQPNILPTNLKSLTFGKSFNQIILPNTLPTNLKSLIFGFSFNQIIQPNTLPKNLGSLTFGYKFNQIIQSDTLPTNLKSLTFGYSFSQIIQSNTLPTNLQSLSIGYKFNQIIQSNTLPTNLQSLTFGYSFNQIIQANTLPTNLKSLTFGYKYNQIIQHNTLPTNLESLTFGWEYNQIIQSNTLPTNLKSLIFGHKYTKFIIVNELPTNLKVIKICNCEYPFLLESDERLSIEIPNRKWNPTDIFTVDSKRYHKLDSFNNQVYLVACEQSQQLMVCKIKYNRNNDMMQYERLNIKIQSMKLLKGYHNFVQLIDYYDDKYKGIFYLFMEYCPKDDLQKLFNTKANQTYYFPEETIWEYISQLFSMLEILKHMNIVLGDIKLSNMFIGNDDRLILGDFGDNTEIYSDQIKSTAGTVGYFTPNIKEKYSPIEINSVGSTILKLLSCHKDDFNNHDKFIQDRNNIIISPERYSQKLIDFVKSLLEKREDSISFEMILNKHQNHDKYVYGESKTIKDSQFKDFTELELGLLNEPVKSSIPSNIKTLKLGDSFDNNIDISQSNSLESIIFGKSFNQIIQSNTLPTNLQSLTFGDQFNQIILPNTLPTNLKSLTFGYEFNQIVLPNTLPTNLQSLTFGHEFNQIIQSNTLPTNLQSLTFGKSFNQIIQSNTLPPKLESLILGQNYTKFISVNNLPTNLKLLKINNTEYPFLLKSNDDRLSIEIPYLKWNPTDIFINLKRYHLLKSFDNGINNVNLVACEQSNQLMICKIIDYNNYGQHQYDRMHGEKESMQLLKGYKSFVQIIDYYDDQVNRIFYLFIEYCSKGDLFKLFSSKANQTYHFPEYIIYNYMSQLFSMLEILKQKQIVHCDIKPSNIFIEKDDRLILGDFGCSIEYDDIITPEEFSIKKASVGTEGYLAPEVETNIPYQSPIDIYSVGSTILRILSCHEDDINNHDNFIKDRNNIIISQERYSQKLSNFVKLLVAFKREDRQSLQMILNREQNSQKYIYKLSTTIQENLFSNDIKELELEIYNESITSSILPTNIKTLKLGDYFNCTFDISQSNSLEVIIFGNSFNQTVRANLLPSNLKSLTFGSSFSQTIKSNTFPTNLESLTFGNEFNQIIQSNTLPTNLKSLTFGDSFNQIIEPNTLPTSLESLTFGTKYNQIIQANSLPTNLESLTFGDNFNKIIQPYTLPPNLKSLTFGDRFNQIIEPNTIPTNLESLTFGKSFNQIIQANTIPTNLKSLTIW